MTTYLDALSAELDAAKPLLAEYSISSVYVGGGSPTIMNPDAIGQLIGRFCRELKFERPREVTIEAMPQTIGTPSLSGLNLGGFTRYSLSMQSGIDEELMTLGCDFALQHVDTALLFLNKFNHRNVNLDVMYGIPGQTAESWQKTLDKLAHFNPAHISVYPFPDKSKPESSTTDDTQINTALIEQANYFLADRGYRRYSVHHFAKPGAECRHFIDRYGGLDYIGFGLGARSLFDGISYENSSDLSVYLSHSADFEHVVRNVVELSAEELITYRKNSQALLIEPFCAISSNSIRELTPSL
jgi:oxygen-independent coproporphyrinogen-3 oxidase